VSGVAVLSRSPRHAGTPRPEQLAAAAERHSRLSAEWAAKFISNPDTAEVERARRAAEQALDDLVSLIRMFGCCEPDALADLLRWGAAAL
jgi:hypothetical protein